MRESPEKAVDLGGGHSYVLTSWSPDRELNPQYDGIPDVENWGAIIFHTNPVTGKPCAGGVTFDGEVQCLLEPDRPRWELISLEPLHIEPSVLCRWPNPDGTECGDHGYVRDGRWVVA